jgi:hypothetical protein
MKKTCPSKKVIIILAPDPLAYSLQSVVLMELDSLMSYPLSERLSSFNSSATENFVPRNLTVNCNEIYIGLPDLSRYKIPKRRKIYQITTNYIKCP